MGEPRPPSFYLQATSRDNDGLEHSARKIRVALISGGRSGEHEISLKSAESIKRALDAARYEVSSFVISKTGQWSPRSLRPEPEGNPGIDVVFPVLHGTFGEDGTVQGLLELADLPYVGAGVLASAISMDKAITKKLCAQAGLPVVEHIALTRGEFDPASLRIPFEFPVFVKPANLGSSVGITKAKSEAEFRAALNLAMQYDRKLLVERGVIGREFECAILGGSEPIAAEPCEIIPSQDFYTYEDKYLLDKARIELPANLAPPQTAEIQRLALACFDAVGCEGMARVDFLMDNQTQQFYVNEINTIPGFTSISMYTKMFQYSGIQYPVLLDRLIEIALNRFQAKSTTQYSK